MDRRKPLVCLALAVATIAAYGSMRNHGFVNIDDGIYVYENPSVAAGLTWEGLVWAFREPHFSNWHPLTWLSHMLDCQLFGLDAGWHHVTNLLIHVASAVLLLLVLARMTGSLWRSAFVAALFALHPLHVESVAWISERKDVLSTLFWVLTMGAWLLYVERRGRVRYLMVLLCFTLGLLAKPMLVTLPFVLLLLDLWPLGRLRPERARAAGGVSVRLLVVEKIPLFALSAASCVVTFLAQEHGGSVGSLEAFSLAARVENALVSYVAYVGMTIWPAGLAVYYPHPQGLPAWQWAGAALLLGAATSAAIAMGRRAPYLAVGWLWYLGTLVPVIGIVQVGGQSMADRYTYVPHIGLFLALTWGAAGVLARWRIRPAALALSAGLALLACGVRTRAQVGHWKDGIALFEHALEVTEGNDVAHNNMGNALARDGRPGESVEHYLEALRVRPDYAEAHYNLAIALARLGRLDEAIESYEACLSVKPGHVEALNNLGNALERRGKLDEAVECYLEALRIRPHYAEAHYNLGIVHARRGRLDEAVHHYREALRIEPEHVFAHNNLGNALVRRKRPGEAIRHYEEALRLRPDFTEAHNNLGVVLASQGRLDEAVGHFSAVLRIDPDDVEANRNLGHALMNSGELREAIRHYRAVLRVQPEDARTRFSLGSAHLALGDREAAAREVAALEGIQPRLARELEREMDR